MATRAPPVAADRLDDLEQVGSEEIPREAAVRRPSGRPVPSLVERPYAEMIGQLRCDRRPAAPVEAGGVRKHQGWPVAAEVVYREIEARRSFHKCRLGFHRRQPRRSRSARSGFAASTRRRRVVASSLEKSGQVSRDEVGQLPSVVDGGRTSGVVHDHVNFAGGAGEVFDGRNPRFELGRAVSVRRPSPVTALRIRPSREPDESQV